MSLCGKYLLTLIIS